MDAVYYNDEDSCIAPVEEYLGNFDIEKDQKILLKIKSIIDEVLKNNGVPQMPWSRTISDYSFCEIRLKKGNKTLIRITYFCYKNFIVLLHAFEKPERDYKGKELRKIIKEYDTAEKYYTNFINNPKLYKNL